jgi:hypothetical protein
MPDTAAPLPPAKESTAEDNYARNSTVLRAVATWGVIGCTALWTAFFFLFIIAGALRPSIVPDSWFLDLVKQHPGGTIGVAIAAVSAFSVVAVLDILARDPIKFKVLGIELEGAAGPVVLWVLCFLSIIVGGGYLWDKPGLASSSIHANASSPPPVTAASTTGLASSTTKP